MAPAAFDRPPFLPDISRRVVAFSPGRTELAGNHVDHQGGITLTGTLDLGMHAQALPNGTRIVRVQSDGFEPFELDLDQLPLPGQQDTQASSAALVAGMIQLMEAAFPAEYERVQGSDLTDSAPEAKVQGFDLAVQSTIPVGGGLSSSAAFELLVGQVLNTLFFEQVFGCETLALLAQRAECEYFGKPCGCMDQMAIAYGGIVAMDFAHEGKPLVTPLQASFEDMGLAVILVDVHADHAAASDLYAAIPADMKAVARACGHTRLADVSADDLRENLPRLRKECGDVPVLRTLHYIQEISSVRARIAALQAKDAAAFIRATRRSGSSSAQFLQNVSEYGAEQPAMVALAYARTILDAIGARQGNDYFGAARIHGGGFGGSIQAYVPEESAAYFVEEMDRLLGAGSARKLTFTQKGAYAQWQTQGC